MSCREQGIDLQRAVITRHRRFSPPKFLLDHAPAVAGIDIVGLHTQRFVEAHNRVVGSTQVAQHSTAVNPGLCIGRVQPKGAVVGRERLGKPAQILEYVTKIIVSDRLRGPYLGRTAQ